MTDRSGARFDDGHLDAVLASIGEHLVVEADGTPQQQPSRAARRRVLAVAAAVLAAAAIGVVAVAPVREAVADWLGIGTTRVERSAEPPSGAGLPPMVSGLQDLTRAEAEGALGALGRRLPDTDGTALGPPDRFGRPPEGGVMLIWDEGDTTLWIHPTSLRAETLYRKLVGATTDIRPVDGLGDGALLIGGDHILVTPHRRLAATTVLLWTDSGVEYRLESNLAPDTMIATARAIT